MPLRHPAEEKKDSTLSFARGAAFTSEKAPAFSLVKVARPPEAGGLSFCGLAAKTCAAPRRQARFLIAAYSFDLGMIHHFRRIAEPKVIPYYQFDFPPFSVEKSLFSANAILYISCCMTSKKL